MATKPKLKPTIVDTPFVETVKPEAAAPAPEQAFTAYFESLMKDLPSWKRVTVGLLLGMAVSYTVGYCAMTLVVYAVIGAIMCGAPIFIAQILYVLGLLISIYAGYRAGGFTYLNVIDETVDAKFAQAKGWVTGLFTSTPQGATA